MKKAFLFLLALALPLGGCSGPEPGEEAVVLVHGLGRSRASMMVLAQRLEWAGYGVVTVGYKSLSTPFPETVATVRAAVERCCAESPRIHFVGHSLGGLVIRGYLAETPPEQLGRVVLVAPPNQGSLFVDWLGEIPAATEVLGPVGSALGTDSTHIPASLPPPDYEMGIIAGNRSIQPIGHLAIPGPDDGIVSVEQTRVDGVPVIVLPRSHAFITSSRYTAQAVVEFLRTGEFGVS
ncbi:MAG: alpha/beta fold hydrolase [Gemmatimonadota bacterium]|nr:alpha/beta fold hydrolase [Gemmatimonadota bacterium]